MGGTLSSEQQAHDQLVNAADKQGAFSTFLQQIQDKPNFLSTLSLKTNSKSVSTILSYLSTCLDQKNYTNIVPVFQVLQRLLRFESFYRDLSKSPTLEPIIKALDHTTHDSSIEEALKCLELMVECQVFNRGQAGCCGGSSGESNLDSSPNQVTKNSSNDPKIHTLESNMKTLIFYNNFPVALSKLFTHYTASFPGHHYTEQQHRIVQTILRLIRLFMKTTIKTSVYPQIVALLKEFEIHSASVISLTINTNPQTRMEATESLLQLLIHSTQETTRTIQLQCLNHGYILWYVYIALHKANIHGGAHRAWDIKEHHPLYSHLIGFLCDGNDTIGRLLFRMIPKCLHDNAKARQLPVAYKNFNKALYLSTSTPSQKNDFEQSTHGLYNSGHRKHGDWLSVFEEIDRDHTTPLIVWTQQDKAELIEILLNENVDFHLQLELSPSSLWDYDGFEVDYSSQSKYLIVNRYYLHLLLPHFENSEPQNNTLPHSPRNPIRSGATGDEDDVNEPRESTRQLRAPKQIGNRPTALATTDGVVVPTRDAKTDPYAISMVDLSNFMSACFQRAVVEDDVGWKLACLRMMRTLYVHNTRILQETNFMPYLLWLLTPKTTTGTLFDVNETTTIVFTQSDSDDEDQQGDESTLVNLSAPNTNPLPLQPLPSSGSSRNSLLATFPSDKTQSSLDPNASISKFESKIEREIAFSLTSSFNNPRWRDQILKFLNILFDYAGNINKFVAGNGVNTLLYFINNVHRENHADSLQEIEQLVSQLTPDERTDYAAIPAINMQAILNPQTLHTKHHSIASLALQATPPAPTLNLQLSSSSTSSLPPAMTRVDSQPQGFRRSSVPNIPTIDETLNEARDTNTHPTGLKIAIEVDGGYQQPQGHSNSATPQGQSSPRNRLVRNASDFHAHSPLASGFDQHSTDQPFSSLPKSPTTGPSSHYDQESSPTLALLDPLWHQAVTANQLQREANPLKKCDLLSNTPQPDGITEVARKSLLLLLKIVTNAPRLRKKIFKPRVLTSLVQLILVDDVQTVNTALQILIILIDANTHVIPNLAKTGVFFFLLFAARRQRQFSPEMIQFIDKYHTKQNVPYISRGQSIYQGLFPEPLINLSLQAQGGEYFCAVVNQSATISHRILWDNSHKEIMSRVLMLHLAPFIQKLVLCPFSTYTFPFDGKNPFSFKVPTLTVTYPSISHELFVGNVYVRLFNLETNRLNRSILETGKCQKISISHGSAFLLSLLREVTQQSKYYTTRTLTLLEHFQLLSCVQPKPIAKTDKTRSMVSATDDKDVGVDGKSSTRERIIFYNEVEFTTPTFPPVRQQRPYQSLLEQQQNVLASPRNIARPVSSSDGKTSPHTTNTTPQFGADTSGLLSPMSNLTLTGNATAASPQETQPAHSEQELELIKAHLLEALQAIAVLSSTLPHEEDIFHFKYPVHLIALLASTPAPYDSTNRCLVVLSQIFRALLVIPSSTNATIFVNHGFLGVIMRALVIIGQTIMSHQQIAPGTNPFDHTQEAFHNDNIDLFIQYLHIFTAALLQGRSSHRPGPFYFQLTMALYDTATCRDFFVLLQTILATDSSNYLARQYLVASTFRFLQSISLYDQSILHFQLDNVGFLKDRLSYQFDLSVEATTFDCEHQQALNIETKPSVAVKHDAVASRFASAAAHKEDPVKETNLKSTLQQALLALPTVPDLEITGLYTPHRYIAQYGLLLDTIRALLVSDDDKELTVYSIGGVASPQTALPAFLGKTPTKNPNSRQLGQGYPSNRIIFNAGLYLDEIIFDQHDGQAGVKETLQATATLGSGRVNAGKQLTRTTRAARSNGGGTLLNARELAEERETNADFHQEERMMVGCQRGSLLSGPQTVTMAQPQLQDLLYTSPLSKSHRDLLSSASNSPKNGDAKQVMVLKQKTPPQTEQPAANHSQSVSKTINDEDQITTLEDTITLQRSQQPFVPCTPTYLQHEKSLPIRKEAIVFLTLLLSTILPTVLSHPSTYSSNTCLSELNGAVEQQQPTSNPPTSTSSQIDRRGSSASLEDDLSVSSSSGAERLATLLTYRWRSVEVGHFNITQQLLTPGALLALANFVIHTRYFTQHTTEYFTNVSMLTMVNAHCHVPAEYKQFVELIDLVPTNGGELITPTFIWSKQLRAECLSLITTLTQQFHLFKTLKGPVSKAFNTNFRLQSTSPQMELKPFTGYSTSAEWPWANKLLAFKPAFPLGALPSTAPGSPFSADQLLTWQQNVLSFPTTISILTNELVVEGVYLRIWLSHAKQSKDKASLLPKPLNPSHLFNHICFALYRYALLAPHRLTTSAGAIGIIANSANVAIAEANASSVGLVPLSSEIEDLDTSLSLDVGYLKKQYDLEKCHHSTILVDKKFALDFTSPIKEKLYDLSFLPQDSALLSTTYSALTQQPTKQQINLVFHQNIQVLSMCLHQLAADPQCDIKALSAPLIANPSTMIPGKKLSPQVYQYHGVYRLLSLLACERTPAATINVVCTTLFILQKDLVENVDLKPSFASELDLKDKKTSDSFKFNASFDIISNCCQYLIALLVRPYQALPPDNAPASFAAAPKTGPPGHAPGRRDSALATNPFVTRNNQPSAPSPTPYHRNSVVGSNPQQAPIRTLHAVHQRSEHRVHLLLVLDILYNLILSQTLLRRSKAPETLFKTGVVATLLGIILHPTGPHPQAMEPSELNWTLSSHITMKSLFSTNQQQLITHLDPAAPPTNNLGDVELSSNTDIERITYFPFTSDIDTTPLNTPSVLPLTIPEKYTFDKQQRLTIPGKAALSPAGVTQPIPSVVRPGNNSSNSGLMNGLITNHPFNCANNTYTTAQRLMSAKILGLLFIHPVASPYFRSAITTILSPQFYPVMTRATENPLPFISQLYTECVSPAFVWNSISRTETTQFIHNEVQNLYYYHLQQNRYFAQFLYFQEKKADFVRQRYIRLGEERKLAIAEDQIELHAEQLAASLYSSAHSILTDHYMSLYQQRIVDYQHHVSFISPPQQLPVDTTPPKPTPATSFRAPALSANSSSSASSQSNPGHVANQGLAYLTPEEIATCTSSDLLDQYYGIFSYDHTALLFKAELEDADNDDDEAITQAFPTTTYQGTLTQQEVSAQSWSTRFARLYLTHQVHIPIANDAGVGMYLNPFLMLHKQHGTADEQKPPLNRLLFRISNSTALFNNLANAIVEQMGKMTSLKQYIRDAENLHQEGIEDGYLHPETGQLNGVETVATIRRKQLVEIHLQERTRIREAMEQQRREQALQHQQDQKAAARRTSTLVTSGNPLGASRSTAPASTSHASRTPTTPRNGENPASERDRSIPTKGSDTRAGVDGEPRSGIPERNDDEEDDEDDANNQSVTGFNSSTNRSGPDPMDDPHYLANMYSTEQLFSQVESNVVTKNDLFQLYYDIPLESSLLAKMLDTISHLLSLDIATLKDGGVDTDKGGVEKAIGTEEKVSKLAEFILLESESDALTFKIDEQLYFQNLSYTDPKAAVEQGAVGPNPQDFYPPPRSQNPTDGVLQSIPMTPLYDFSINANPLVFKAVLILQALVASPSVPSQTQSLLAMHKAKISRWLLPVLFLGFDRYELVDENGNAVPSVKPTILYPITYILYTIISNHNEHVDDLINMGALFYYLNLIFQKQHIPDHLWKTVIYSVCKIAQRSKRSRLETLNFFACEFRDLFLQVECPRNLPPVLKNNTDDANINQTIVIGSMDDAWHDLEQMLTESPPPCPACGRHWGPKHCEILLSVFKKLLPQLTVRVITYTPEKGRVYMASEILGDLGYEDYDPSVKEFISEDVMLMPKILPSAHIDSPQTPLDEDQPTPLWPSAQHLNRKSSLPPPPDDVTALEFSDSDVTSSALKSSLVNVDLPTN